MSKRGHVEVYKGHDGLWRFRLVGANGEKQDASQPYHGDDRHSKYGAKRGARTAHPGLRLEVLEPVR